MTASGPRRRMTDHVHPEYWEEAEQHRFEERIAREMAGIRKEVKSLGDRLLLVMGGLGLLAFLLPLLAPFIRSIFNAGP